MEKGEHIRVKRSVYYHHGIYFGDGTVVHFTGEPSSKKDAKVMRTSLFSFLDGGNIDVVEYSECFLREQTLKLALAEIGKTDYHLIYSNCEHFATYCKIGKWKSEQVKDATGTVETGVGVTVATATGLAGVSVAGVAGFSGAGIMSGLAFCGGTAIGGIGVLAATPSLIANIGINKVLKDEEHLTDEERENRKAGRIGAKVGTVLGAAGTVGTISATGAVAGLSGAGITSGLAAIGGTVGGGMLAGTVMTIAAPAVVTAAVGYGVYKFCKWLNS